MIITVAVDCVRRPIARNTSCIAGARPTIPLAEGSASSSMGSCRRWVWFAARSTVATISSMSKGLAIYSKAPRSNDVTVVSRSECAVIITIGKFSYRVFTSDKISKPSVPGMRMSETITLGWALLSASSSSSPFAKSRVVKPAFSNARLSTQRMLSSSSTTQTIRLAMCGLLER